LRLELGKDFHRKRISQTKCDEQWIAFRMYVGQIAPVFDVCHIRVSLSDIYVALRSPKGDDFHIKNVIF